MQGTTSALQTFKDIDRTQLASAPDLSIDPHRRARGGPKRLDDWQRVEDEWDALI